MLNLKKFKYLFVVFQNCIKIRIKSRNSVTNDCNYDCIRVNRFI